MKKNDKVSIIVPVYNVEKFLRKAIDSLLEQTYSNIEIILIDDGSTDDSGKIIDEYADIDNRIISIHKENSGVSETRNMGLEIASGKYITFIDSDDYIESNYIESAINQFRKYRGLDIVTTGFFSEVEEENDNKNSVTKFKFQEKLYKSRKEILNDFILLWDSSIMYNIWNKVYLKSIIDENNIKFKMQDFGEDVEFNKDYLKYVNKMYNLENCYYHYIRERKGATTNKYKSDMFEIRLQEYHSFNSYFEKCGIVKEKYIEFSARRYIERTLGCIENIFVKECKMSFREKYNYIKNIINKKETIECLKVINPKSKKVKIMIIPYKLKLIIITLILGKALNIVKTMFPAMFNKLKNER